MPLDRSFIDRNRASTNGIRELVVRLTDAELQHPVGKHWTAAITLTHHAFWDRRMMYPLDQTERAGKLVLPEMEISVNEISLPLWAAIPPREAARIAIETAEAVDRRVEDFPLSLLEEINANNERWLVRSWHHDRHLDQVEAELAR